MMVHLAIRDDIGGLGEGLQLSQQVMQVHIVKRGGHEHVSASTFILSNFSINNDQGRTGWA